MLPTLGWAAVVCLYRLHIGVQRRTHIEALILSVSLARCIDGLIGVKVWGRFCATFECKRATPRLREARL